MENKIEHTVGDIVGSTIDFRKKKIIFDDPYKDRPKFFGIIFFKQLFMSWSAWIVALGRLSIIPFLVFLISIMFIDLFLDTDFMTYIGDASPTAIKVIIFIPFILLIFQYFSPWEAFFQRLLVESTGWGKKNKGTFTNFETNHFVLPGISNLYLEFNAYGDVSRQLKKIRIKQERDIYWARACRMDRFEPANVLPVWNAHFYFDKVPKDGALNIIWL